MRYEEVEALAQQLFAAAKDPLKVDVLTTLLDLGIGDVCDDNGCPATHAAAAFGNVAALKVLIGGGCDINFRNRFGWTPLLQAAWNGQLETLVWLIENHADILARTFSGANAVSLAARNGHCRIVEYLLSRFAIQESEDTDDDFISLSPLMFASLHGEMDVCKVLLNSHLNEAVHSTGLTPLMMASISGHDNVAQALLENGADPNAVNVNNMTALDLAISAQNHHLETFLTPLTARRPETTASDRLFDIFTAIELGDFTGACELISRDSSNSDFIRMSDGCTPLILAAMHGQLDIVKFLLSHGASVDHQDKVSGWTALMQAVFHSHFEVANCLVSAGANLQVRSKDGYTASQLASTIGTVDAELIAMLETTSLQRNNAPSETQTAFSSVPRPLLIEEKPKKSMGFKGWWKRLRNRGKSKAALHLAASAENAALIVMPQSVNRDVNEQPVSSGIQDHSESGSALASTCEGISSGGPFTSQLPSAAPSSIANSVPDGNSPYAFADADISATTGNDALAVEVESKALLVETDVQVEDFSVGAGHEMSQPVESGILITTSDVLEGENDSSLQPPSLRKVEESISNRFGPLPALNVSSPTDGMWPCAASPTTVIHFSSRRRSKPPPPLVLTGISALSPSARTNSLTGIGATFKERPCSYHDREHMIASPREIKSAAPCIRRGNKAGGFVIPSTLPFYDKSIAHLPVTPTRKTDFGFGVLGSSLAASSAAYGSRYRRSVAALRPFAVARNYRASSKCSSSPHLQSNINNSANSPGSSGGSSSLTPRWTPRRPGSASLASPKVFEFGSSCETVKLEEDELEILLHNLQLERYYTILEDQEVDSETLLTLTDDDLKEIGISNVKDRTEILQAVQRLNKQQNNNVCKEKSDYSTTPEA